MAKVIQFQVVPITEAIHVVYALKDDGTIWVKNPNVGNGAWVQQTTPGLPAE